MNKFCKGLLPSLVTNKSRKLKLKANHKTFFGETIVENQLDHDKCENKSLLHSAEETIGSRFNKK